MEVLHARCAGLDVHSRRVNACVRIAAGRKATAEHREFATTTAGLLELAAWLTEAGCTHVTRKQLVREITRHTQRLQKTLEDANVKLTHVVTDILGVSGRAILAALIAGETDPERLADCTNVRVTASRADIVRRGARPGDGAPPFPAGAAPGADRCVARRRAETGAAGRRGAAPFSRGRRPAGDDARGQ